MILLIKTNKESLQNLEFVKPIENVLEKYYKVVKYKKLKKEDLEKADKIIISGTSLKDNEFVKDLKYFSWIKDFEKPILGICAGAQIIGLIYGGKILKKTEIGMTRIKMEKQFLGTSGEVEVYELHNNYIKFGEDFEIFARNEIEQAVKHKSKEIYATLFHPEVGNKEMIKEFIQN